MSNSIIVSVCCQTYNHAEYIVQCMQGILMQKTNFDFEILVHDDASNDETTKILKTFEKKYNGKFRNIYQTKNLFKEINSLTEILYAKAKGKYIAVCDGDDYWTDPLKLQKQFDFMESHPECVYMFTNYDILTPKGKIVSKEQFDFPETFEISYLLTKRYMPQSATVFFRREIAPNPSTDIYRKAFNGDWVFFVLATQHGKIGFIKDRTAVYRQGVGIISNTSESYKLKNGLETNKELNRLTNYRYNIFLGDYEWHYENITYAFLEEGRFLKGVYWFCKTIFYKIKKYGLKKFMILAGIFIKHCFKLILN